MKYIDIHAHLDSPEYDADRNQVLARMKENGVGAISVGANLEESKKAVNIAEQNEEIWACIGIHPENLNHESGSMNYGWEEKEFEKLIQNPKVVAVGECGLDYFSLESHSAKATRDEQINLFEKQIRFALKHDKPLMLHIRASKNSFNAYDDALEILNNYKKEAGEKLRGNVHFFAGNIKIAKKFLDLGFTMSFTGVITFLARRNSAKEGVHDYDEVIKYIPQNMLMSETDAPFVAPVPHRGKRNEPVYVIEVIKKLAEIRSENFGSLNGSIVANAKRVFGI